MGGAQACFNPATMSVILVKDLLFFVWQSEGGFLTPAVNPSGCLVFRGIPASFRSTVPHPIGRGLLYLPGYTGKQRALRVRRIFPTATAS
jgi:hypothetical protein